MHDLMLYDVSSPITGLSVRAFRKQLWLRHAHHTFSQRSYRFSVTVFSVFSPVDAPRSSQSFLPVGWLSQFPRDIVLPPEKSGKIIFLAQSMRCFSNSLSLPKRHFHCSPESVPWLITNEKWREWCIQPHFRVSAGRSQHLIPFGRNRFLDSIDSFCDARWK
jgi:hypothetical protein